MMEKEKLLDFESQIGECTFSNLGFFMEKIVEMRAGQICIIYCRPNSDRDVQVYSYNRQPERSKREDIEVFCPIDGKVLDNSKPFHANYRFCADCQTYREGILNDAVL